MTTTIYCAVCHRIISGTGCFGPPAAPPLCMSCWWEHQWVPCPHPGIPGTWVKVGEVMPIPLKVDGNTPPNLLE
jgi:hypothetical protein